MFKTTTLILVAIVCVALCGRSAAQPTVTLNLNYEISYQSDFTPYDLRATDLSNPNDNTFFTAPGTSIPRTRTS